jgi:hypothetical protein
MLWRVKKRNTSETKRGFWEAERRKPPADAINVHAVNYYKIDARAISYLGMLGMPST